MCRNNELRITCHTRIELFILFIILATIFHRKHLYTLLMLSIRLFFFLYIRGTKMEK